MPAAPPETTAAAQRGVLTALVAAALVAAGLAAAALANDEAPAGYVADVADLPLMGGLEEVPEAGLAFDKPGGRIVEAYAHGTVSKAAVRGFYSDTLPQLGWRPSGPDRFRREDELLVLDYLGEDGDLTVRFSLQPR